MYRQNRDPIFELVIQKLSSMNASIHLWSNEREGFFHSDRRYDTIALGANTKK